MRTFGFLNIESLFQVEQHLTVPLLWSHVTPVLAYRQDVLHQQTAVVFSIGCTAV